MRLQMGCGKIKNKENLAYQRASVPAGQSDCYFEIPVIKSDNINQWFLIYVPRSETKY